MIINANSTTNRTKILVVEYLKLLALGTDSDEILVFVQNSKKKKEFIEQLKKYSRVGNIGSVRVYSFFGFVYNYILDNWAEVENAIKNENRKITPNLCGLEVSQYIFKECLKEVSFVGYNSKTSLLHQLLRRYSLINLNALTKKEVLDRSKILIESYSEEASQTIEKYKIKTIQKRAFDYIRQLNLFEFLYKKLDNKFKYVFLDDGDEITPSQAMYLNHIKPTVEQFFIGYDGFGSSRLGYLGAININFEKFIGKRARRQIIDDPKTHDAKTILEDVREDVKIELETINSKTFLKRNEMIDCVLADIKKLIDNGTKPSEIALVTPVADDALKSMLDKSGFKFNFLTKSEKLNENPLIAYILELLKIINDKKNQDVSPYTLKGIFIELLNLDKKESVKIIQQYKLERDFKGLNILDFIKENEKNEKFKKLIEIYEKIRFENLSTQMYEIVNNFVPLKRENSKNILKINQLLKQIYDFEEIFNNSVSNLELINQLENTIISENPLSDDEIDEDSIVVLSAQKIIDYSYKTKYQFLLDANSENWLKQDIGPLYNAWVMQKTWSKESFDVEDNINLTKDRTARTLYKLFLLTDSTTLYSSVYDSLGRENFSGIDRFYQFKNNIEKKASKPIVPREDQKEVLNYQGGLMSVSATAGSGKTTIMLLLLDKILSGEIELFYDAKSKQSSLRGAQSATRQSTSILPESGLPRSSVGLPRNDDSKNPPSKPIEIEPKNIFVLTFMESAARNFKERIKARYPDLAELPSISTIHGLALRIIKENNNYSKLELDYDFEIIDEIKRAALLAEIGSMFDITIDKIPLYDSAISTYKNELSSKGFYVCNNKLFLSVYNIYQRKLKEQNLIDYDDLLLLSLKLLKENPDVLDYYQNLVKVIIEDEAQDSSPTQQELIRLLGGKYQNIIRCGDINQAITSTFTNSDVKGFKEFIKNSKNVVMDRCQRCATGVLESANETVNFASEIGLEPFSDLVMKPVQGINIIDNDAVSIIECENEKEENNYIIQQIKNILKTDKNASIAVLLRNNFSIGKWSRFLEDNSISTFSNSDSFINNPVFRMCYLISQMVDNPFDLKIVQEIAKFGFELGFYDFEGLKYASALKFSFFLEESFDFQIWWDLTYFLYKNHVSGYDFAFEIGNFYFSNSAYSADIPLVAEVFQKLRLNSKNFEDFVLKLSDIKSRTTCAGIKFYNSGKNESKNSTVQLMTLHKSKGDEFDYVFIPELVCDNLETDIEKYNLKENTKFIQKVKKFPKNEFELKKEIIEENLRLIYVGITRAKKKLVLSAAKEYKRFSKVKKTEISPILDYLKKVKENEKN